MFSAGFRRIRAAPARTPIGSWRGSGPRPELLFPRSSPSGVPAVAGDFGVLLSANVHVKKKKMFDLVPFFVLCVFKCLLVIFE